VPAQPPTVVGELRRELVGYARSAGASEDVCDAVALAVSEAVTNVVRHAYVGEEPGPIVAEAHLDGDGQLLVLVSDEGLGLVPRADSPGLGLGLGLMAQMADEFTISNRHDTRGTIVSLRFSLQAPAGSAGGGNPQI
jgi:anti-sigma regulatory factor (Ser/Thr protein kinase)